MKRATDKYDSEILINAGFKVKPDMMWRLTSELNQPIAILEEYRPNSRLFYAPAFTLSLLLDSVPKFTSYGWFTIRYSHRANAYLVGYVDDEDSFTKVYAMGDLLDAVFYLLLWTLKNPEVVTEGKIYIGADEGDD